MGGIDHHIPKSPLSISYTHREGVRKRTLTVRIIIAKHVRVACVTTAKKICCTAVGVNIVGDTILIYIDGKNLGAQTGVVPVPCRGIHIGMPIEGLRNYRIGKTASIRVARSDVPGVGGITANDRVMPNGLRRGVAADIGVFTVTHIGS